MQLLVTQIPFPTNSSRIEVERRQSTGSAVSKFLTSAFQASNVSNNGSR